MTTGNQNYFDLCTCDNIVATATTNIAEGGWGTATLSQHPVQGWYGNSYQVPTVLLSPVNVLQPKDFISNLRGEIEDWLSDALN